MVSKELKEYYRNNKEKLRRLAKHGEPTIRAMALAILKRAGDQEYERQKEEVE